MRRLFRSIILSLIAILALSVPGFSAVRLTHIVSVYLDGLQKGLRQPEGVACGRDGLFIVADTGNGRLVKYSFQSGTPVPGLDIKVPQLPYPVRVQIDSRGNILALDERQRRIARLNPEGVFQGYVEVTGLPGSVVPRSFKIDENDNIYILDISSAGVEVLNAEGKLQKTIPFPDHYGFLSDLAVDFKGTIFVIDSTESVIYSAPAGAKTFTPFTQSMKETLLFPTSITTDSKGTIYLVDQNGGDIIVVGQDGSFQGRLLASGWKEGLLRYPSQCCISKEGDFIIADRSNNRVQIYKVSD